jgi:hypothetical protein
MRGFLYFTALLFIVIYSCNDVQKKPGIKYPYSLHHFPKNIRPFLVQIVNEGYIWGDYSDSIDVMDSLITDKTLIELTQCEHPVLRSLALTLACGRESIDHYNLMMNHLDDTARVSYYFQCASFPHMYVSDYLVRRYQWKNDDLKEKTIEQLLKKHRYLECAYEALNKKTITGEDYDVVKSMAKNDIGINIRSYALYQLATFRKTEDTALLHRVLEKERYRLDGTSFLIMREFPDSDYETILEKYQRRFYRNLCDQASDQYYNALCYPSAIASYKNQKSAEILRKIFYKTPFLPCMIDEFEVKEALYNAIMANQCPLYSDMIDSIKQIRKRDRVFQEELIVDPIPIDSSLTKKTIGWDY